MAQSEFNRELIEFLDASPTPWHAVSSLAIRLQAAGFAELHESQRWLPEPGKGYFIRRNGSSIIAWRQPIGTDVADTGWRLVGAHTDSPCLRVKPQPELIRKGYFQLGIEVYGGVLLNPWFDRDLSLAGRVSWRDDAGQLHSSLIDFERPVAIIPSLAIHLDREANSSRSINAQTFLPAVMGQAKQKPDFRELLREHLINTGIEGVSRVLDYELCFYDAQGASELGLNREFIASARLDNLLSCFIGLKALIDADAGPGQVLVCNDHEEVGSMSASGAQGPMLKQWLERVMPDADSRNRALAASMLISADNAHGVHPNFADRHDDNHGPLINAGPVIKTNANQRYASNSETSALFRHLAEEQGVPVQSFVVRTDMACGSTIGPITAAELGVRTLDIGVPQFAMHSIRELAGSGDAQALYRVLVPFLERERV
ncbi:putative M18 family aminopeptidase 2 [Marinobacterium zhoushanense]|uniref:M18 family aminopeptidase n=1 Tax=Marinobacterium zhoushanense TaxID=1679163 RepID=A0ABQ1JZY9_9GAMM|nr:M18 family aminopeptidase [Marinobacterium zhoushanense]GGB79974.1 putative M18 family aminopeptidase 2 [Marinobacterium zhoushanense]